jgi:creatinine amidohydrolase
MKNWIEAVVDCIKAVKADENSLRIQNEFYEKSKHPLDTKQ